MEKLIEDLIIRLTESKAEVLKKIENESSVTSERMTLILAGKLAAYDQCILELKRTLKYFHECVIKC
ncbi:MAG: hypothetical protein PHD61_06840 [Bacteroidales bacterium]|nr:hypothetical protein [Lentimicrobiaceae bacterium]MDD5695004.1 hypothetical protein [Bacteroidales bacterium]